MTTETELYAPYLGRAKVQSGGEIFLNPSDSLDLVATCERMEIAVIGVEAFRIDARGTMPYSDAIADYSPRTTTPWRVFEQQCNRSALNFLQRAIASKGQETWFSFVLLDSAEYDDCLREIGAAR
jgi:hypothetical protein